MEEAEIMLSLSLRTGDQQTKKIFPNNASETRHHDSISPAKLLMKAWEIDINESPPKERREWRNNKEEEEEEEEEGEDESSGTVNGGDQCKRKKLRLTVQQSAVLEDSFKQHNTLSPKKKLELAKSLSLKPRQVEVWFQNRRARTKLKQTEVDYEYFRQCCEALTQENRRLQRELMQLRSLKQPPHFYMQVPATTLVLCSSCEREKVPDVPTAIPL